MRDALGDLAPRGQALRAEQLGQIVEDEDEACVFAVGTAQRRRRREQGRGGAAPPEVELALDGLPFAAAQPRGEGDDVVEVVAGEDLAERLAGARCRRQAEHAGGGPVHRRETARDVEGDDPGGHRLEDRLRVAAAPLEFGVLGLEVEVGGLEPRLRLREIRGHPVERVDEDADLVVRARLHAIAQVAGRHLPRALGELLDGHRDAAGEVEAEPREREDDDQRHQQEHQDVDALDRVLQELELLVLGEGLGDPADLGLEALGHVGGGDHGADHVATGLARRHRPHRGDGLDEVAGLDLPYRRHLLAVEALAHQPRADLRGGQVAEDRVLDVHEVVAAGVEDGQRAEAELLLLLDEVGRQRHAPVLGEQAVAGDRPGHVLAVPERRRLQVLVVRLRHGQRLVERALDLGLEPALDRGVDEVRRDDEDQDRGRQRQEQEREDQLGLKPRPDDLLTALEGELDQVPEEEDEQQEEDDQVQVEEGEDHDGRGDRDVGCANAELERGGDDEQDEEPADDDQVPLASVLVAQERHVTGSGSP